MQSPRGRPGKSLQLLSARSYSTTLHFSSTTVSSTYTLCLQDKCRVRASGRQVLADDGECAVQDSKQQDYVSWDGLRR